jgi:excisionase family DNA binding protein
MSSSHVRHRKGGSPAGPKRPYSERRGAYMTYEEVADELAVKVSMIERLVKRGELRRRKVGSLNRIPRASLDEYLEKAIDDA